MNRRREIGRIEKFLTQGVEADCRSSETFVEQHGPVGNGRVEFRKRRLTAFRPLVGNPAAHRSNPGAFRNDFTARRQCLLDFPNRARVFQDGVIARAVAETDDVNMRLDQAGYYGAALQIDDADSAPRFRNRPAHREYAIVADGCRAGHRACRIHGVNPAVDQDGLGLV